MKKLGLIVNPVAGMGGRVGLKGTDGTGTLRKALELGAVPRVAHRVSDALRELHGLKKEILIVTFPGKMGEDIARENGFAMEAFLKEEISSDFTTREDTLRAADAITGYGVDLLLFAGGDGTARDICECVGADFPVLGIPAGVKIHSAVFGCSPKESGEVARRYLNGEDVQTKTAEVMDIDEDLFRKGQVSAKLYGYLLIPYIRQRVQGLKAGSAVSEETVQRNIAAYVAKEVLRKDTLYFIGPGTTTRALLTHLGLDCSLLGVDCIYNGRLLGLDLTENQILEFCERNPEPCLIVTPVGGQGFLFGRGNQQLSPEVLRHFTRDRILILCTPAKLHILEGNPLRVDTGDADIDAGFSGYIRLVTGFCEYVVYKIQ